MMPSFMLPEEDLPASASPGLETLPAMGETTRGPVSDSVDMSGISLPTSSPAPKTSGLGLAEFKSLRGEDDQRAVQEYMNSLSPIQKVGMILQIGGAAANGQPNPIDQMLENKRKREAETRQEFSAIPKAMIEHMKAAEEIKDPAIRGMYADMMERQLGPLVGAAIRSVGTQDENDYRGAVALFTESKAVQDRVIKLAAQAKDKYKFINDFFKDDSNKKWAEDTLDTESGGRVLGKLYLISQTMAKMPQYSAGDGRATFTMGDLLRENNNLPPELKLTTGEIGTISRKQVWGAPYGLQTDKTIQEEQQRREKDTWTDPYQMNGATVQKNKVTGEIRTAVSRPPQVHVSTSGTSSIPLGDADKTGDDYLKTLPAGVANTVKGIADGRIDIKSLSIRGGEREAMLQRVTQYKPDYNAANYGTKAAVQKDFTSGKAANNVTAINTAVGHMGAMFDLGEALNNGDIPAINKMVNVIATQTGDDRVVNYETAKSAVANELMRVFRQVGAATADIKDWESKFSSAGSPQQIKGALKGGAELLKSRIDAVNDQWDRGMETKGGYPKLFSERSRATFIKIGGKLEDRATDKQPAEQSNPNAFSDAEKERRYQEWKRKNGK